MAKAPSPATSAVPMASMVLTCAAVRSPGTAADPVTLPFNVAAAIVANLALLTAFAAMLSASDPAAFVTSPVCAGSCAACKTPVACVVRLTDPAVAKAPSPATSAVVNASLS